MEVNGRTYCPLDVIRLEATIERLEAQLETSVAYGKEQKRKRLADRAENTALNDRWDRLVRLLETVEESDSGKEFHPTQITSCRLEHTAELRTLFQAALAEETE